MIQTIKLTLNGHDQFDAVIMDYFKDKKNLQGYIRQFCYEQIRHINQAESGATIAPQATASIPQAVPVHVLTPKKKGKEVETPEITKKLDSFG